MATTDKAEKPMLVEVTGGIHRGRRGLAVPVHQGRLAKVFAMNLVEFEGGAREWISKRHLKRSTRRAAA